MINLSAFCSATRHNRMKMASQWNTSHLCLKVSQQISTLPSVPFSNWPSSTSSDAVICVYCYWSSKQTGGLYRFLFICVFASYSFTPTDSALKVTHTGNMQENPFVCWVAKPSWTVPHKDKSSVCFTADILLWLMYMEISWRVTHYNMLLLHGEQKYLGGVCLKNRWQK